MWLVVDVVINIHNIIPLALAVIRAIGDRQAAQQRGKRSRAGRAVGPKERRENAMEAAAAAAAVAAGAGGLLKQ